jgi:Mce-associated membrane protein
MRLISRFGPALDEDRDDGSHDADLAAAEVGDLLQQADAQARAAEAAAAAAHARAQELRRQANAADDLTSTPADHGDSKSEHKDADPATLAERPAAGIIRRRPRLTTMIVGVALVATCALLAASGCMVWHHLQVEREQQRRAEFSATASQAVVTLMSIDASKAQDDVQQIIENSTGQFRDDFQSAATDFVKAAQDSKAVTKASVRAAAVESMTGDSAVVLVTAATTVSNSAGADQQPRTWRLSLDMVRDGGQIKMSKVDFVP